MEQKFMLLVYYKGVAPVEQEIPTGAGNSLLLPIVTNTQIGIVSETLKYILHVFITTRVN